MVDCQKFGQYIHMLYPGRFILVESITSEQIELGKLQIISRNLLFTHLTSLLNENIFQSPQPHSNFPFSFKVTSEQFELGKLQILCRNILHTCLELLLVENIFQSTQPYSNFSFSFQVTSEHFELGKLRIKCRGSIPSVYNMESDTFVVGEHDGPQHKVLQATSSANRPKNYLGKHFDFLKLKFT